MPRDGSNVYHYPTAIEGIPNQPIESADYNSLLTDLQQDLNLARPIVAGGTGSTSADTALIALSAEKAGQVVTNYDSQVWLAGSFSSAANATGSPAPNSAFSGIAYLIDPDNITIEARAQDDAQAVPARKYIRQKKAGVWGSWNVEAFMLMTGGTITGNVTISSSDPTLTLNKQTGGASVLLGSRNGVSRWRVEPGNSDAESSQNFGSNFSIKRYSDAGALLGEALNLNRSTGNATLSGTLTSTGYATRTGVLGNYDGNIINFAYSGTVAVWVNSTNLGNMTISSDYRVKRDVIDLPSMWNTIKGLRPIKYRHQDFTPPSAAIAEITGRPFFPGDDIERWGFIAHELQEALTPSAATGAKDAPDVIQSPNPFTVIAALTKALQEAMTRIEALEAKT